MKIRFRIISAVAFSSIAFSSYAQQTTEADAGSGEQRQDEHHYVDEVVVSASPLERTVEEMVQPMSMLSGDALAREHAASIGETLANQPGVSATYFGPVASRPVIRGQFGERVLVLSNGLASLDASALSEDHAVSIDGILAKRIEVIRGPATLLYGSGAAGGLVNVVDSRIRNRPLEDPIAGKLAIGSDSATGKREGALALDFGNERVAGHIDYFRRDTDNVNIPGFAESARLRAMESTEAGEAEAEAFGTLENTSSEIEGGAASATWTQDDNYTGVSVSRYSSNYGIPGHHHHEEEAGVPEEEGEEEAVRIDLDQTRIDINGGYELDAFFKRAELLLSRSAYKHTELEGSEIGTVFDNLGYDSRLEVQHRNIGILEGALGFQFKSVDFKAIGDEAFVPTSETTLASVFLFEEAALSDSLILQASARIERQEIDTPLLPSYSGTTGGGSIGAIWSMTPEYTLAANLALTQRHPNSTELYAEGPHLAVQRYERGSITLGNGVLDKEQSTNIDVTLRGKTDRVEFNITGFINDVDDYILLTPTAGFEDGLQVYEYGQTDVEMYGFEADLLFDVMQNGHGHLHARLFSDFVYGEEKLAGRYLPRLPPLRYGVGLHYRLDNVEANLEIAHNDSQSRTAANELPTDSHTLVSVEASYYVDAAGLMLFVRGTNLGDADARRHTSPLKEIAPLPGRSLQLGLRWNF